MTRDARGEARGDEARRRQLALLTELREVEHWRRLVAARLDLAVAAVAAVDEPVVRTCRRARAAVRPPRARRPAPAGHARHEAGLLLRLRDGAARPRRLRDGAAGDHARRPPTSCSAGSTTTGRALPADRRATPTRPPPPVAALASGAARPRTTAAEPAAPLSRGRRRR